MSMDFLNLFLKLYNSNFDCAVMSTGLKYLRVLDLIMLVYNTTNGLEHPTLLNGARF